MSDEAGISREIEKLIRSCVAEVIANPSMAPAGIDARHYAWVHAHERALDAAREKLGGGPSNQAIRLAQAAWGRCLDERSPDDPTRKDAAK